MERIQAVSSRDKDKEGINNDHNPGHRHNRNSTGKGDGNSNGNGKGPISQKYSDSHSNLSSEEEPLSVLDKKKQAFNSVFGLRHWQHNIGNKPQSPSIQISFSLLPSLFACTYLLKAWQKEETATESSSLGWAGFTTMANVLWVALYGWWMALLFFVLAGVMALTVVGVPYANLAWAIGKYLLWPYGKYIIERRSAPQESDPMLAKSSPCKNYFFFIWYLGLTFIVLPLCTLSLMLNWLFVISIPMAKMISKIIRICIVKEPENIQILSEYSNASAYDVLFCTYKCVNYFYFRYKILGMNIVFFNLLPIVVIRVAMVLAVYITEHRPLPVIMEFLFDLVCIVPITFYIGNAISSIAAQTNYMMGALLNVTFGSLVDTILFAFAIKKGGFDDLVKYTMTGGFMSNLLLIPGLSMIVGGTYYQNQSFNPVAAGVGCILLWISIVGVFSPTIFYEAFGRYNEDCDTCVLKTINETTHVICTGCHSSQEELENDPLFENGVRKLMYFLAGLLPVAYITGLVFTFKTHTDIFTQDEDEGEEEGDGSPAWSIKVNVLVLAVSTMIAGLLADDIVNLIETIEDELGLGQAFLGITLLSLVPSITELVNAVKFATHNQIALSLEIGSAGAIQASLIQVPLLVILGATLTPEDTNPFNLIFSLFSVFAVMISVITFNYIAQEGKTNYFIGTSLIVIYLALVASFYFIQNQKRPVAEMSYFIQQIPVREVRIKDLS